ncbi:MAG: hypothetical protein F7B11_00405 [Caldisphaeraceae archaeon]|nr:hypothetical protein [Caldisphaeraceae archaeon]
MFEELAKDIIESFNSEVGAFIFDRRLIKASDVNNLIQRAGLESLIKNVNVGNITVLFIDKEGIEKGCLYEKCSDIEEKGYKKSCVKKCAEESISLLKRKIEKSLIEATNTFNTSNT